MVASFGMAAAFSNWKATPGIPLGNGEVWFLLDRYNLYHSVASHWGCV